VISHECGHGAFSDAQWINDAVGELGTQRYLLYAPAFLCLMSTGGPLTKVFLVMCCRARVPLSAPCALLLMVCKGTMGLAVAVAAVCATTPVPLRLLIVHLLVSGSTPTADTTRTQAVSPRMR
jgi:hypothetical protein